MSHHGIKHKTHHQKKIQVTPTIWGDEINPHVFPTSPTHTAEVHSKGKGRDQCNGFRLGRATCVSDVPVGWKFGKRLGGFFSQWTYIMGI